MPRDDADPSRRTAVVFVSVSRAMGGPARSLLTVLRHLGDEADTVLFAPSGALSGTARSEGLVDDYVEMPHRHRDRRRSRIEAGIELARYVRAHRDRIVAIHANGQSELNLTALASLRTSVPVVMWAHTSVPSPTAGWLAWFWRRRGARTRWLAVSHTAGHVLADTLGIDDRDIEVVGNPVDPDDVVGDPVPHDGVRVGYLGLAAPHKGFDLLPPIVERVDRDGFSLELYVAPPPPDLPLELRPPWDALATLEGRRPVYMLGRTANVRRAYAELDIVLCPSRQESFGRIAAEAMLNGLPVVASDIAAYREVVGHEEGGLLFPPDDVDAAAAAIRRLVDDPDLRRRLGERARERAQRYAPQRVVPRLEAAYRGD
jgi:glycosyltransferase involved in cell wall biosynthesis